MISDWQEWREFAIACLRKGTTYYTVEDSWPEDFHKFYRDVENKVPHAMKILKRIEVFKLTQRLKGETNGTP